MTAKRSIVSKHQDRYECDNQNKHRRGMNIHDQSDAKQSVVLRFEMLHIINEN